MFPSQCDPSPPQLSSRSAELYYRLIWGVGSLKVKHAESGEIIRFSYRVLDADKARTLNDEPSLLLPACGVLLRSVAKLRICSGLMMRLAEMGISSCSSPQVTARRRGGTATLRGSARRWERQTVTVS